ncbi:MAG TPA: hypothetical protein PLE45_00195 [Spirochaetota bacterium]|nr:hypothetical protein [Spirochaetota bacterium]HOL55999.1 hypothetical protein [Spirochaetota bacterium]HPP03441.1 hypothetical protein [Spirochaetota bacterium]
MEKEKKALIKMDIFPIEKFNYTKFSEEQCRTFVGSPIKHPYEDDKFILISEPLNPDTEFIEFHKENLIFVEELPSLISENGESIYMAKVFIKKGSIAIKYKPFEVS